MSAGRVVFVTGFPGYLATRMIRRILDSEQNSRIMMLVDEVHSRELEAFIGPLPSGQQEQLVPLYGKIGDMDLGLSGPEVRELTEQASSFFHMAGPYWLGTERPEDLALALRATREVLAIARETPGLQRFNYFSTAFVSGERTGVVLEEQLEEGQRFRNAFERTRYQAEVLVRSADPEVPVTIYRPTIIIGDSRTGELDRVSGPYYLFDALVSWPLETPLPLPGRGDAPMHLVPVEFVVEAAYFISRHPDGAHRTFHITDPNPLPARRVFELIARGAERTPRRGHLPSSLITAILGLTGLRERFRGPGGVLEYFDHPVIYRTANLLTILNNTPLRCPLFEEYVDTLVKWVRSNRGKRTRSWAHQHEAWSLLSRHRLPAKWL